MRKNKEGNKIDNWAKKTIKEVPIIRIYILVFELSSSVKRVN